MKSEAQPLESELDSLYAWIDSLPLSRQKKNISRDFSDCVLMSQTIHAYFPKLIELHNYPPTNSLKSKILNWQTLNQKVLYKLGIFLKQDDIEKLANAVPSSIENLLLQFKRICVEEDVQKSNQEEANQSYTRSIAMGEDRTRKETKLDWHETKVGELKDVLKILKENISYYEQTIRSKDSEIKRLEEMLLLESEDLKKV